MGWDAAKVIRTESNSFHWWIREVVEIWKRAPKTGMKEPTSYLTPGDTILQRHPLPSDRPSDGSPSKPNRVVWQGGLT